MAKRKRKRTPEVLWRLFKDRARTLADTIVSLIPPQCHCAGRRFKCLHCTFHDGGRGEGQAPTSHLLRPDDSSEYRDLLNKSYIVVPDNAPPLPPDTCLINRWSQHQIVCRTIQRILTEKPGSCNVIWNGYQKVKDSSTIVNLLSCCSWQLLLQRVGDGFMCYLLMHTSIFLFFPNNKHQQVAGEPVSCAYVKLPKHMSEPGFQSFKPSRRKKRRRVEKISFYGEDLPCNKTMQVDDLRRATELVASSTKKCFKQFTSDFCGGKCQMELSVAGTTSSGLIGDNEKQPITTEMKINTETRKRLPSWLRLRKCKLLTLKDPFASNPRPVPSVDQICVPSIEISGRCLCCLSLQTSIKLPKHTNINRKPMFYSLQCSSSPFPMKHLLSYLKPDSLGASFLINDIFGLSKAEIRPQAISCVHGSSYCLYHSLIKLMKKLVHRAQHCQHSKLLDKHCAVPSLPRDANKDAVLIPKNNEAERRSREKAEICSSNDSTSGNDNKMQGSTDDSTFMYKSYCSYHKVVSFIWAACRNIIPPPILGSPSSWRILRRNIYRFIQLRHFEKFSLIQGLNRLKICAFPFLSDICSFCSLSGHADVLNELNNLNIGTLKQNLFERWIFWFFSQIVVPLVEANFYVTESQHGKHNLYYYRKSVWMGLSGKASTLWKDKTCRTLDGGSVQDILANRPFGFSKLRLCPKRTGTRVIANLKASSKILQREEQPRLTTRKVSYLKSVNSILRDLLVVLKDFRKIQPEKWGSSVFDYNDIYKKLRPFLLNLKKESPFPSVFIVSADVHKAFDTINQDKLLAVINETLTRDEYVLQKDSEISWNKKSLFAYENRKLMAPVINDTGVVKVTSSHPPRPRHAIIVNEGQSRTIRKEELQLLLNEHVKRNIIQINQSFLLQVVGIPQGSVLSSFLCSLYLGHLERNAIYPFLDKVRTHDILEQDHDIGITVPESSTRMTFSSSKWICLRLIDDFLFISTSKKLAASFLSRLRRGFREYNCYMNEEKFCFNFCMDLMQYVVSGRQFVSNDGISYVKWSGLLINSCTLEIQADYTRYLDNHLSSSLTVCWQGKPGRHLKAKLCDYMRPKCYPLFYDPNINSPAIIRLNIYQAFLLCAMKFHCYVCQLSKVCKLQPRFFLSTIERSIRYTRKLMKRRMCRMDPDTRRSLLSKFPKEEIHWLALTAYVRALTKKQSRHKVLLRLLRTNLASLVNVGSSSELKYAVDDSHSSVLWKIKY